MWGQRGLETGGWLKLHLKSATVAEREGVSEGANQLLGFIRNHPSLRTPQISESLGVSVKTLERWIERLREQGKIEFRGSTKTGGYWELKKTGSGRGTRYYLTKAPDQA